VERSVGATAQGNGKVINTRDRIIKLALGGPLRRELAFEIFMAANPYPNPNVALKSLGHGAVIARHAYRPKARVGAQPFQLEGRMRRILAEFLISSTRGVSEIIGQGPIKLPEVRRSSARHGR
jgi:hypothetical protein